ncbi:MAG: ABC transporter substrate-binding protein [Actinomycetaceae bacterium]|nr:ABC transporter substrate-binding protein [Actinomycetaceae bacterium]
MGFTKKIIALISIGALTSFLASCATSSSSSSNNENRDSYVLAQHIEPDTNLIPSMAYEDGGGVVVDLLFEGLVRYDESGDSVLAVAQSISSSDNGKTWDVKLKEGKKFSDGSPVTSASFVDAWNWAANPSNEARLIDFFAPIEGYDDEDKEHLSGLKIISDTEFTITLSHNDTEFSQRLGYKAYYPVPSASLASADTAKEQGEKPISNGPYILTSWDHDEQMILEPNPHYEGDKKPKNNGIIFKIYTDDAAAYNDLLANNLDVVYAIPSEAMNTFGKELGERAINQKGALWQSITIPYYLPHFSGDEGRLRRQALSMAIDRGEICSQLFVGTRSPASDFVADVIPGHSDSISGNEVLSLNVEKAKELWKQADEISPWGDSTFEIAYNADSSAHKAWVEAVVNQLHNNLGINAAPKVYAKFDQMREDVVNQKLTSAVRTGWQADYPSAYNFIAPLYQKNGSSNDSMYENEELETILSHVTSKIDASERQKEYDTAQAILMRDLPAIPLWNQNSVGGYSEKVSHVHFNWQALPIYTDIEKK